MSKENIDPSKKITAGYTYLFNEPIITLCTLPSMTLPTASIKEFHGGYCVQDQDDCGWCVFLGRPTGSNQELFFFVYMGGAVNAHVVVKPKLTLYQGNSVIKTIG